MRPYLDLPHYEQALLLVRVVQLIADGDTYRRVEDVATRRNTTPEALWQKICTDEGFEACQPWLGFPNLPRNFPIHRIGITEHPLVTQSLAKLTAASGA